MPFKSPKKNGTIEVRVSDQAKAAFMAQCRRENRTASQAIRAFIDERIAPRANPPKSSASVWRIGLAGMVGAAIGVGAAAPSLAQSAPSSRTAFDRLDRDHDGVLSYREFRAR